mmetsp:Transcript_73886/g.130530  ORF Transcript_73886/g.130530 Transcript_73886/m.130530 type:complete len:718 (-) Transcript_73886:114-2267(-)
MDALSTSDASDFDRGSCSQNGGAVGGHSWLEELRHEVRFVLQSELTPLTKRISQDVSHELRRHLEKYATDRPSRRVNARLGNRARSGLRTGSSPGPRSMPAGDAAAGTSEADAPPDANFEYLNSRLTPPMTSFQTSPQAKLPDIPESEAPRALGAKVVSNGDDDEASNPRSDSKTSAFPPEKEEVLPLPKEDMQLLIPGALDAVPDSEDTESKDDLRIAGGSGRQTVIAPGSSVEPESVGRKQKSEYGGRKRLQWSRSEVNLAQFISAAESKDKEAFSMRELILGKPGTSRWKMLLHMIVIFVDSEWFDYIMGGFLISNAAIIGGQVEFRVTNAYDISMPSWSQALDWTFCLVFLLELTLRLTACSQAGPVKQFFTAPGWKWNVFDTAIVMFQLFDTCVETFAHQESEVSQFLKSLGILRALRLAKLIRLIRLVRLIPELKSMVYLILASAGSFTWTVVLMVMMMYVASIYFTEVALETRQLTLTKEEQESLEMYWGSIGSSMLSLYMAISGGEDWRNFLHALMPDSAGPSWLNINVFIFCTYIAFATLVMLNLVTGVFVEGAQRIIREDQDTEIMRMACKVFFTTDVDQSQEITKEEFDSMIGHDGLTEYCEVIGITANQASDLFGILDEDHSNTLSIREFVRGCLRLRNPARAMDVAQAKIQQAETRAELTNMKTTVENYLSKIGRLLENEVRYPYDMPEAPHVKFLSQAEEVLV